MAKRVRLFQLWKEIFTSKKQIREIEEAKQELGKNLNICRETSDPVERLKSLDAAEANLNKVKTLIYQMKERQTALFDREVKSKDIRTESEFEDLRAYISALRIVNKIGIEGYLHGGAIEKWTELLTWLGFDSPKIGLSVTLRITEEKNWKVIIIKDSAYRQFDDMSPEIIKRQKALRKVFDQMGCRFYYQTAPSSGTKITIMIPSNSDRQKRTLNI